MNTWFHSVTNLTLAQRIARRAPWLSPRVVLYASILPDVPLFILTLWYFAVYGVGFGRAYDSFYYEDPLWIVSHNVFHGPLVIVAVALVGWALCRRARAGEGSRRTRGGAMLLSFAFGTGLHSFLDILMHNDDGPLLLFPFDWNTRFSSPVSYWDPEHYGLWVFPVETVATIVLTIYLIQRRRSRSGRATVTHAGTEPGSPGVNTSRCISSMKNVGSRARRISRCDQRVMPPRHEVPSEAIIKL